jgi:hypothetical protein
MHQPFTRATLFLSFIKGPAVHEWNMLQVNWLMTHARTRALPTKEFLYNTIEAVFWSAFTYTMSVQRVKAEFQLISMECGDLNGYTSKFERLAHLSGYDLNSSLVLDRFGSKLIPGLYAAIVNVTTGLTNRSHGQIGCVLLRSINRNICSFRPI